MSTLSLLHLDGHWLAFDGDHVRRLDARPRLDRAAITISDFDNAVSQVIALEGSPAHAGALIEKRLRADGLIDNESKILIHQSKTVGNGYQALFTAVPLDRWQQMFVWAEGHDDHCLLLPSMALLWRMLRPGRGVVLHSGRQFTFLANLRSRIVHASALAFSEDDSDLIMTVASLAERAGHELTGEDGALESLEVEWFGTLTAAPQSRADSSAIRDDDLPTLRTSATQSVPHVSVDSDTAGQPMQHASAKPDTASSTGDEMSFDGQFDASEAEVEAEVEQRPTPISRPAAVAQGHWLDETLLDIFSERSGASVRLGPHTMVRDEHGVLYRSGIAHLVASTNPLIAVNASASRLMYVAERVLPWASAASLLLALALGGLGGRWALAARVASDHADALDAQVSQVEVEIAGLQAQQKIPDDYRQLVDFVQHAGNLHGALDPNTALRDLRKAAGDDVRILRLRLDPATDAQGSSLRVDGMVKHASGSGAQGMQVARFVQRLREAGYLPEAIDPQLGNVRSQSPGGSFSYQLRRANPAATPDEPAATPEKKS